MQMSLLERLQAIVWMSELLCLSRYFLSVLLYTNHHSPSKENISSLYDVIFMYMRRQLVKHWLLPVNI